METASLEGKNKDFGKGKVAQFLKAILRYQEISFTQFSLSSFSISRAIVGSPKVLVLDEATSALVSFVCVACWQLLDFFYNEIAI